MDSPQKSNNQSIGENSLISKSISQNIPNIKCDMDKATLNLFKGIVIITRIKSINDNKPSIVPTNNLNPGKKISNFIDNMYNKEEHLNNNQLLQLSNLEESSQNISIKTEKRTHNIKLLNLTKLNKRSLVKKDGNNITYLFLKKKNKKCNSVCHQTGYASQNKIHKLHKYLFFNKLIKKNRFPSKTPYLDKKERESAQNVKQFNLENNVDNSQSKNDNKNNKKINIKNNENEKNNGMINSDKKLGISTGEENKNNVIIYKSNNNNDKNETKKLGIDNNINKIQNMQRKNENNFIINILTRPFFCCLKS